MPAILERSDTEPIASPGDSDTLSVDAVVIGAGIAGLTAALKLQRAGHRVLVLEASGHIGGAIQTLKEDGYLVERGPNTVLDTHTEIGELIDQVNLTDERLFASDQAKKRFVVRGGKPVALPTSPGAFLQSPLFSTKAKLRLMKEPFVRRSDGQEDESVASFTTRRLGQEFLDYAIDPFVSGVYAGRPENLSVRHAFPKLEGIEQRYGSLIVGQIRGARERKKRSDTPKTAARMFSFKNGLSRLPEAISEALGSAVRIECRVTAITSEPSSWFVQFRNGSGESELATSRAVVFASGLQSAKLLGTVATDLDSVERIEYPPLSVVAMGFRAEDVRHPLDGFGLLVPSKENRFILGALFSSTLFPDRAPKDHVLITAFVGGARAPESAALNDQRILASSSRDLKDLLGLANGPMWYDITRWEKSIPQYNMAYGDVKATLDRIETENPGLVFAGNYRSGISVADSIKSGMLASEQIGQFLNQREPVRS